MTFATGIVNDLSDSASIADPVVLVAAEAVKLSPFLGTFWNDMPLFTEPTSNRKFEIFSRSETQRGGTIGAANWDIDDVAALDVVSTVGLIKGLVLKVESEYVVVSSITSPTKLAVIARGAAGTTAATHASGVAYTVVGSAINDEDLKDISSVSEVTSSFLNYMQTVAEPIDWTKGGEIDPRNGLSVNMIALLQQEAMTRVARNIYSTSILGLKQQASGESPYKTAGLIQQLTDTTGGRTVLTSAVGGAFTEAALITALRAVTNNGTPTTIYLSAANKKLMNAFNGSSAPVPVTVNTDQRNTVAGAYVDSYNYEGLILDVKMDLSLADSSVPILNIAKCQKGWKANDQLMYHDEPIISSRENRASFNGSFGMAIADVGYEHTIMTGIS
jgi:hypothetical protein